MPAWPHIETSQLTCTANQLTGFYMRATLAINGLVRGARIKILGSTNGVSKGCLKYLRYTALQQ